MLGVAAALHVDKGTTGHWRHRLDLTPTLRRRRDLASFRWLWVVEYPSECNKLHINMQSTLHININELDKEYGKTRSAYDLARNAGATARRWGGGGKTRTIWSLVFPCNAHRHDVKRRNIAGDRFPAPPVPPPMLTRHKIVYWGKQRVNLVGDS